MLSSLALLPTPAGAQPVGPEFQVNASPVADPEMDAGVSGSGAFVVVWNAGADGVFGRRYTAGGIPLTGDVRLGEGTGLELRPRVGVAPDGSFFVVWLDNASGSYNVHGRRFSSSGAPLAGEFRINATTIESQTSPDVAVSPGGSVLVVWVDFSDGNGTGIKAKRFGADGTPLAGEFRVNGTTVGYQQRPSVTASGGGGFVVAWDSDGGGSIDVLAQRFAPSGVAAGGEIAVNSFAANGQFAPAVAADALGNFVVVWTSYQAGEDRRGIYAQRFAASGAKLGSELRVNAQTTGQQDTPTVASDSSGRFVVMFHQDDGIEHRVLYREFAAEGTPKPPEGEIGGAADYDFSPSVASNASGAAAVAWSRNTAGDSVGGRRFALSPDPLAPPLRVNSVTTGDQIAPAIAAGANGSFVVAFQAERPPSGYSTIIAQRFSPSGTPAGAQIPVSSSPSDVDDSGASLGADSAGSFVVVWSSYSPGTSSSAILARLYDAAGTPLGTTITVDSGSDFDSVRSADVDRNGPGDFVVTWVRIEGAGSPEIVARRYAANGAPKSGRFPVNTYTPGDQAAPRVALDGAGNFTVVWVSPGEDGSGTGVIARRFGASGVPLGSPFLVNGFTQSDQDEPDVAFADGGGFVIVWRSNGEDGSGTAVEGQRFAASGAAAGAPFAVNAITGYNQNDPRIAFFDDEGFVVSWTLSGLFVQSRSRLFTRDGTGLGTEFGNGNTAFLGESSLGHPVPAFAGPAFAVAWTDRGGDSAGFDIAVQRFRVRFCTPGDADGNGVVNVSDVLYLINNIFAGGPAPTSCANANGDSATNVSDVLYLINHLFAGGPIPI